MLHPLTPGVLSAAAVAAVAVVAVTVFARAAGCVPQCSGVLLVLCVVLRVAPMQLCCHAACAGTHAPLSCHLQRGPPVQQLVWDAVLPHPSVQQL